MADSTLDIYDARAQDYAARTQDLLEWPEFEALCARLPAKADVLDLGCGPGHYAAQFAAAGTGWRRSTDRPG